MLFIVLCLITLFVICLIILKYHSCCKTLSGRVAIVTAHPDDEVMFFAPTILSLLKQDDTEVYLICVSNGDFENKGRIREKELIKCCKVLCLKTSNIVLLNNENFLDGPQNDWNSVLLAQYLTAVFKKHNIRTIVTFGPNGVSGHSNHISLYKMLRHLTDDYLCYYLQDFNVLRKYLSFMNLFYYLLLSIIRSESKDKLVFPIQHVDNVWQIFRAMRCHEKIYKMAQAFERTQVDMNVFSFHHSTPASIVPTMQTQLAFNPYQFQPAVAPIVSKPRPIVIEKLIPSAGVRKENNAVNIHIPEENELSSQKLATAVQLAKMDMKKLKSMLTGKNKVVDDTMNATNASQANHNNNKPEKQKQQRSLEKKSEHQKVPNKSNVNTAAVSLYKKKHVALTPLNNQQHAINTENVSFNLDQMKNFQHRDSLKKPKSSEVVSLQNRILNFTQQLIDLIAKQNYRPVMSENNLDEYTKKLQRAEEQRIRSNRILYNLQRKITKIQSDRSSLSKPHKQNMYMENLISTQRATLRTLQVFLTHVPLFYETLGDLPPSYLELAEILKNLVQVFSESSSAHNSNGEDIIQELVKSIKSIGKIPEKKSIDRLMNNVVKKPALKNAQVKPSTMQAKPKSVLIPKQRIGREKFDNIKSNFHAPTVLSRIRQKDTIVKQNKKTNQPQTIPNKPVKVVTSPKKDRDEILVNLIRSNLKNELNEQKRQPSNKSTCHNEMSPSDNSKLYYNSPPASPRPLSRSSKSPPRASPQPILSPNAFPHMDKEIKRQLWLDNYKASEFRKLEKMNKKTSKEFEKLKREYSSANHIIDDVEAVIRKKLEPLISKAEEIAQEEAKRSEKFAQSVNMRLAHIVSSKAISDGERLAEYILDDLIRETAMELQTMENENEAEKSAANLSDRQALDDITKRIEDLEKDEENLRRYYQSISYDVIDDIHYSMDGKYRAPYSSPRPNLVPTISKYSSRKKIAIPDKSDEPDDVTITIPSGLLSNVLSFKEKYEKYLDNSSNINDSKLTDRLCEEILDDVLASVSKELNDICEFCIDNMYEKEFLQSDC